MSTNEFDKLIAKSVSRVSYEYDTNDWDNLTIQLAAARRKKRAVVFAYLSSGIAASVAIVLISIIALRSEKKMSSTQYALHTPPPAPLPIPGNTGANIQLPTARQVMPNNVPAIISKKQVHHIPNTISNNAPAIAYKQPENTSTPQTKGQTDTFNFEQKMKQHGYEEPILSYTEKENTPGNRSINISVAAGVNYGTVNTGYAIGAAAGKKLSNKFGLELTVAYVSNTASTYGNQSTPPPSGGPIFGPPTKPIPASVVTSPLNYLQFAPMADYSISKKIIVSAGADLQRLLQGHDLTILYNDNQKVAPPIDLGMLLRTEYAISPVLKAGLSYRLGANNIIAPGNNYFDRNYMQVQLKYKLH